jgi:CTP:molybdopterin cytidylyltransferase MocA
VATIRTVSRDEPGRSDAAPTAIVLAAGAGSRFSDVGHKLTASLPATADRPAESVACRSIAAALGSGLRRVVVVTGRLSATDLGLGDTAVTTVHNPDWEAGQMTSVRAGLAVADRHGSSVAVIGLADQPGVDPSAWRAVAQVADESSPIAVATYDGRRANPVALHRSIWHLLPAGGDEGARSLMQLRPQLVREVPCTGSPTDIDTAEDLRRWQNS